MNFLALPFGQPLPSEREGGTLRFRAVLHGYDPQGARFSVRCRGAVATENCNSCDHLDRWSFPRVQLRQKSMRGLSKCFKAFLSVVVDHARNKAWSFQHDVQKKSVSGA